MKKIRQPNRALRLMFMTLALICVLAAIPAMRAYASSPISIGSVEVDYNDTYITRWKRVMYRDQLDFSGKKQAMLCWDGKIASAFLEDEDDDLKDHHIYCRDVSKVAPELYEYCFDIGGDQFYTPDIPNTFTVEKCGTDSKNKNNGVEAVKLRFRILDHYVVGVWHAWPRDNEFNYDGSGDGGGDAKFTVITGGAWGGYVSDPGLVQVIRERSGNDVVFGRDSDSINCDSSEGEETCEQFIMYLGDKVKFPTITEDYTITAGNTMSIPAGAVLAEGVTLTIEPTAVLSIDNIFYNNGIIDNYGTIIVNSGGQIRPFASTDPAAGTINCYGGGVTVKEKTTGTKIPGEGVLSVMKGGSVSFCDDLGTLSLFYGSEVANFGTMTMPDGFVIKDGEFISTGRVTTGIRPVGTAEQMKRDMSYISFCGEPNIVTNTGTWNNYSTFSEAQNAQITGVEDSPRLIGG